ncbi:MAG: OFA family oxalate/formate antiporter-like MFS transporter [Desulforhopalus sp.]|jgi:OFA family oxalate/formate antiporter-like MFS transporter
MRYLILFSAVMMQMCLGATYSWSVYVQPLKTLTGLQQGPVQVPFTAFYFIFPLTMMIAGTILPKIGPRISAMTGGFLFGSGWLLASLGYKNFIFTTLGIGVISGIGAGMAYIVPIAVCIRWFPNSKGLVTGIAVAGFGGGAALVSQIGGYLMESMAHTPFETFFIFGLIFMGMVVAAGSTMQFPNDGKSQTTMKPVRFKTMISHPIFQILYGAMFIGLAAGFAVNANLKELFAGENMVQLGITGVSLFALANACGRIGWGMIFDRMQSATAIKVNLIFQAVVLMAAPSLLTTATGFLIVATLTGFNYGGVLVIYVSTASRCWGADRVSQIYGWLFSSNIPASLAPIIAGLMFDTFHSFNLALYGLGALLLVGVLMVHKHSASLNETAEVL